MAFKKVSKEEYYNSFMNLDAVHTVDDSKGYPYGSIWNLRGKRDVIAKSIPTDKRGYNFDYFIKISTQ